MSKNVVVSGACGFLGQRLLGALIKRDFRIFALDLRKEEFEKKFPDIKDSIRFFEADFTKDGDLNKVFDNIPESCLLVHLAGYILGSASGVDEYDAMRAIDVNIKGSYKLVEILLPKLQSVCAASTLDVYGRPKVLPITEAHSQNPETFYALTKLAMELFLQRQLEHKIPLTILRFSHIFGKGDPHPKVLQSFINNVKQDKAPIINGDGEDLRDYIHVEDAAGSIIQALNSQMPGIFNVASGKSHSLKELAQIVIRLANKDMRPVLKGRLQPRKDYVFDIKKLRDVLGFEPGISMEKGIAEILL